VGYAEWKRGWKIHKNISRMNPREETALKAWT
jgi:hypothetical protein